MIFAFFDPSPLTVCINCSFFTYITATATPLESSNIIYANHSTYPEISSAPKWNKMSVEVRPMITPSMSNVHGSETQWIWTNTRQSLQTRLQRPFYTFIWVCLQFTNTLEKTFNQLRTRSSRQVSMVGEWAWVSFRALRLLDRWQEEHLARKNRQWLSTEVLCGEIAFSALTLVGWVAGRASGM